MDINLNAPVECLGGERAGHVSGLILNPKTHEFTHLVIKTGGVERIVPATLIRDVTQAAVLLRCTVTNLNEQQPLVETDYIRSAVEYYEFMPGYSHVEVIRRNGTKTYAVKHEQIPGGELKIKRGMAVFATDGRIGQVDDIVVDPVNDHITHIVLREGHVWDAKEVLVEIAHVKSIEDGGIYLESSKALISEFPTIHARQ